MWASCCGLLNEVMGTGAVRGQQPGFGAGAGPFRFAPSAGYSTYPPTNSGSPGLVCKACGQAFSVFRRKVGILDHLCDVSTASSNLLRRARCMRAIRVCFSVAYFRQRTNYLLYIYTQRLRVQQCAVLTDRRDRWLTCWLLNITFRVLTFMNGSWFDSV